MTPSTRLRLAERVPALVGISFAVASFLADRGLWLDEASLGLNLLERGHASLLQPLDYGQAAPLLYLQLVKACADIFGPSSLSMRLPSLLAFLTTVILFDGILQRTLKAPAARIIAMSLLCFNLMLLRYSGELKQYMTETMVCLLVTSLALRFHEQGGVRHLPLLLAGLLGILLSHTAVMVLAMAGSVLLLQWVRERDPDVLRAGLVCGLCWMAAMAGYYILYAKGHPSRDFLMQYWERAGGFGPPEVFGPDSVRYLTGKLELMRNAKNIFHIPVRWANLTLLLVPLGAWLMGTDRRNLHLLLLALPVFLHLLLSYLRIYPFDIRLTIYLLPIVILAACIGLDRILLRTGLAGPYVAWAALIACLWQAEVFRRGQLPIRSEELMPLAREVSQRIRPGDVLWMNPDAWYAFRFYAETGAYTFKRNTVSVGCDPQGGEPFAAQLAALGSDAWLLLTHLRKSEAEGLVADLRSLGYVVTDSVRAHQAYAYHVERP